TATSIPTCSTFSCGRRCTTNTPRSSCSPNRSTRSTRCRYRATCSRAQRPEAASGFTREIDDETFGRRFDHLLAVAEGFELPPERVAEPGFLVDTELVLVL